MHELFQKTGEMNLIKRKVIKSPPVTLQPFSFYIYYDDCKKVKFHSKK